MQHICSLGDGWILISTSNLNNTIKNELLANIPVLLSVDVSVDE